MILTHSSAASNFSESAYPNLWDGLVGAWVPELGHTGLQLRDMSGSGNHGTLTSMDPASDWVAPTNLTATSPRDLVLDYDATNDNVNCGTSARINNLTRKSLSYWLRPEANPNQFDSIVSKSSGGSTGWHSGFQTFSSQYRVQLFQAHSTTDGGWHTPTDSAPKDTWTHVVWTYDNSSTSNDPRAWINGVEVTVAENNTPSGSPNDDSGESLRFGATGGGSNYDGQIGPVLLYNRLLTPQEAGQLYLDMLAPFRFSPSLMPGYLGAAQAAPPATNAGRLSLLGVGV